MSCLSRGSFSLARDSDGKKCLYLMVSNNVTTLLSPTFTEYLSRRVLETFWEQWRTRAQAWGREEGWRGRRAEGSVRGGGVVGPGVKAHGKCILKEATKNYLQCFTH